LTFHPGCRYSYHVKKQSIILIGMSGSGKSTLGPALAEALGLNFIDLDVYIQERDHKTIQEIVDTIGEDALLQLEEQRMHELDLENRVIAPGGSIIYHSQLMDHLKEISVLVYLNEEFRNIETRVSGSPGRGIVGLKHKSLRQIYAERQPLYAKYADITVCPQGRPREQVVQEIIERFKDIA
jgi:shikimate kinase